MSSESHSDPDPEPREGPTPSEKYYADLYRKMGEKGGASKKSASAKDSSKREATKEDAPVQAKETAEFDVPDRLGRYKILGVLGEGGQGITYRAFHPELGREVVLKVSHRSVRADADFSDLREEARLLASVDHPHIARVHDIDVFEGRPFLVLEYVRGPSLQQARLEGTPDFARNARWVASVARACDEAHKIGVVHRDIKPANIVLDEVKGDAKLIDFGIARLRDAWGSEDDGSGIVTGTLEYMAPEQARGETDRIGPRSDIFALGGVLYFLLTGRAPFRADSFAEALMRAREGDFPRKPLKKSGCPAALERICLRAMEADPANRHESAGELADDLEGFARGRSRSIIRTLLGVGGFCILAALLFIYMSPGKHTFEGAVFDVLVDRGAGIVSLARAAPLHTGDGMILELEVPQSASEYVSVLWIDSAGKLHELEFQETPADAAGSVRRTVALDLVGYAGTEMIIACGAQTRPTVADVQHALGDLLSPWPAMAPHTVVRFDEKDAKLLGLRSPGALRAPPDSAYMRARRARSALAERFDWVAGWVFPHQDPGQD